MARTLGMYSEGVYIPFHLGISKDYNIFQQRKKAIVKRFVGDPWNRMDILFGLMEKAGEVDQLRQENEELKASLAAREQLVTAAYLVIETAKENDEEEE